eukprot:1375799-Amorphochlora_amoeboformis.AAC.1
MMRQMPRRRLSYSRARKKIRKFSNVPEKKRVAKGRFSTVRLRTKRRFSMVRLRTKRRFSNVRLRTKRRFSNVLGKKWG